MDVKQNDITSGIILMIPAEARLTPPITLKKKKKKKKSPSVSGSLIHKT